MTKRDLLEILEEFDDDTQICIQEPNNINGFIPFRGFEVKRKRNGKGNPIVVLLSNKIIKNEFNG